MTGDRTKAFLLSPVTCHLSRLFANHHAVRRHQLKRPATGARIGWRHEELGFDEF
jgi:hypothetical protein